jgi:RNA polymerase sigma factor for flagellar operon FliA
MSTELTVELPEENQVAAKTYSQQEIDAMDTQELLLLYKRTEAPELKWPLVLRYEGLIKRIALQIRSVRSGYVQMDDIIDEGMLTILNAIDKYDPDKGVKFETYVSGRLRGMVGDLARSQDWLPRDLRRRAKEINQSIAYLSNTLGRFPTDEEVADYMGLSLERYEKYIASISLGNMLSLDFIIDGKDDDESQRDIPDQHRDEQPELAIQQKELQYTLADGIRMLRKKEQLVISLFYDQNLQIKEIAQVMGVTPSRVSQIHTKAIKKLRAYMEAYMNGNTATMEYTTKRKKGTQHDQGVLQSDIGYVDAAEEFECSRQQYG